MTGVARQAAGCQRSRGVGTGGERSPLACWHCAGTPASSPATRKTTYGNNLTVNTSHGRNEGKRRRGIQWRTPPGQKWEARPETSGSWECPVWAREVSSSAGCWCSPAVLQPCSLSHPRPASYTERERRRACCFYNASHIILSNSHYNTWSNFTSTVCSSQQQYCGAKFVHKRVLRPLIRLKRRHLHIAVDVVVRGKPVRTVYNCDPKVAHMAA